ncbi:MAG: hypothetical protein ACI8P9_000255 [Parasphingorhabdus sp.]|jgi:hypothetical protein
MQSESIISQDILSDKASMHTRVMFYASAIYLASMSVIIQWWNSSIIDEQDSVATVGIMLIIWAPFIVEGLIGLIRNRHLENNFKRLLLISLVPAFRMCISTFHDGKIIWLPRLGWQRKDDDLLKRLSDLSTMPMLFIALMILPVFATELILKDRVAEIPWLSYLLHGSTAFIWFAFTLEFILLVSVAEKKLDYCKKNWLNLIIILLPLIAFLRGFQLVRAFRLAQASKMLRMYRMRSLGLRVYQTMIALSAIERLLHRDPQKHLEKLQQQHDDAEQHLAYIKGKIVNVKRRIADAEE